MCPRSNKVLALRGAKNVYYCTSSEKVQITTLACISATGNTVPPMHVFPGVRFSYNPMQGCIDSAYFGKSSNGWMTQELFNGWLTKHFVKHIPRERPVCLLVDGHSSHIDLETSKFCQENQILLYCLYPHSSHITQPLDVGFFSPLKQAWKKAVTEFNIDNPGLSVDKSTFCRVFKRAYLAAVKPGAIVRAFENSGIYPPNRYAFDEQKLKPSTVFTKDSDSTNKDEGATGLGAGTKRLALAALEEEMEAEVVMKYEERLKENFDLATDPLYNTWKKLKEKSNRVPLSDVTNKASSSKTPLQEILKLPRSNPKSSKKPAKTIQGTACLPKHLSGTEVIEFLEERQARIANEEREKEERQKKREERKKEKEEEDREKEKQREKKAREKVEREKVKEAQEREKEERKKIREEKRKLKEAEEREKEECRRQKKQDKLVQKETGQKKTATK